MAKKKKAKTSKKSVINLPKIIVENERVLNARLKQEQKVIKELSELAAYLDGKLPEGYSAQFNLNGGGKFINAEKKVELPLTSDIIGQLTSSNVDNFIKDSVEKMEAYTSEESEEVIDQAIESKAEEVIQESAEA